MIRLLIVPTPTTDEAAAIEAAVRTLVGAHALRAAGLRYSDVAAFTGTSPATQPLAVATRPLRWRDAARLESLGPGV